MKLTLFIIGIVVFLIGAMYIAYVLEIDDETNHYHTPHIIGGILCFGWILILPLLLLNEEIQWKLYKKRITKKRK